MMQESSDDTVHPALAACASLDSVEMYDVDLGSGGHSSPAAAAAGFHRSPSPHAPMTQSSIGTNQRDEELDQGPNRPQYEEQYDQTPEPSLKASSVQKGETKTTPAMHRQSSSSYNLISPAPVALEKVPSSDSTTVTTASSGGLSMSSSSSMLSAMDNEEEEDIISQERKTAKLTESSNDRGVYHFKVSKVNKAQAAPAARESSHILAQPPVNVRSEKEAALSNRERMETKMRLESIEETSHITTVSTPMTGPDDNIKPGSDQRGVYRFKVQVDEAQLRRAEQQWWQFW